MLNKQNYNKLFVITVVIFLIIVPLFNYFTDPYNVFGRNNTCFTIENHDRDWIYPYLKNNADKEYDWVLIGDSNSELCYSEDDFKDLTGKTLTKVTLLGITPKEQLELLKAYHRIHPEHKNYIIILNVLSFCTYPISRLPEFENPEKIQMREYFKILFTFQAFSDSLNVFYNSTLNKIQVKFVEMRKNNKFENIPFLHNYYIKFDERIIFKTLRIPLKDDFVCYKQNIDCLKEISQYCKENNLNTIYMTNALHSLTLVNFYKSGKWDVFCDFKKQLAESTPFYYDFNYVNDNNDSPISLDEPNWQDAVHPSTIYGKKILEKVTLQNVQGAKVSKDNVDEVLRQETKLLQDYINDNKKMVDEYMNLPAGELKPTVKVGKW